uniref:Peptidase M13 N-terminal domain-containing protein n=1 Tax=Romanomermis culicivorax TaxID=13658 RepID=A0A915KJM4_ROMCU
MDAENIFDDLRDLTCGPQGLLLTVDFSANPCTDFYDFACGKFAKEHPIPDEYSSYSPGDQIQERLLQNLRVMLKNNSASPSKAITFTKMMFGACIDTNKTKAVKSDELRRSLKEIGDWPIISPLWDPSKVDLSTFFGKAFRIFAVDSVFGFGFDTDIRNNAENILSVDQGSLGMGSGTREFYLDDKQYAPIVSAYKTFIRNIAQILVSDANVSISNDQINADVDKMFAFEQKLAKIQTPEENRRNMSDLYNKRNFEYLNQIIDSLNMKILMQNALPKQVYDLLTSGKYQIIIRAMDYLQKVNDLLKTEDKR